MVRAGSSICTGGGVTLINVCLAVCTREPGRAHTYVLPIYVYASGVVPTRLEGAGRDFH